MTSNSKKQKYIIECLLSSKNVFSTCIPIIQPHFFEKNYERVVGFMKDYYEKHHAVPKRRLIDVEFDITFKKNKVTRDEFDYVCSEIETFCKESAVKEAIRLSGEDMQNGNMPKILERLNVAMAISLDKDMGIEFFSNPSEMLKQSAETQIPESTGILDLDKNISGGLLRKQLTMFSANSGVGKSLMLENIALTFAAKGFHVVYISLELPEDMVYVRTAAMITATKILDWKSHVEEMAVQIEQSAKEAGSYWIKRLPQQSTSNDIRAYLKHYELEHDRVPDMLVVDYLDLMSPNCGGKGMNISERDKFSSEQLTEILHSFDMYGLTASQQNRDGLDNVSPNQAVIAGGFSKVNAVDNYISLYMDEAMKAVGKMMIYFLKTRSSSGKAGGEELYFNQDTLAISDTGTVPAYTVMPLPRSKKALLENAKVIDIDMPQDEDDENKPPRIELDDIVDGINESEDEKQFKIDSMGDSDSLFGLMSAMSQGED